MPAEIQGGRETGQPGQSGLVFLKSERDPSSNSIRGLGHTIGISALIHGNEWNVTAPRPASQWTACHSGPGGASKVRMTFRFSLADEDWGAYDPQQVESSQHLKSPRPAMRSCS